GEQSDRGQERNPDAANQARAHEAIVQASLPADLDAGSTTGGAVAGVTARDHLDPECILVLEVRGFAGLAQRIEAVLRRTRGCGGESRKLEDDPGAAIQFRQ